MNPRSQSVKRELGVVYVCKLNQAKSTTGGVDDKKEMEERIMLRSMSTRKKKGKQAHSCACALKAALRLKKQSEIRANDRASAGT